MFLYASNPRFRFSFVSIIRTDGLPNLGIPHPDPMELRILWFLKYVLNNLNITSIEQSDGFPEKYKNFGYPYFIESYVILYHSKALILVVL